MNIKPGMKVYEVWLRVGENFYQFENPQGVAAIPDRNVAEKILNECLPKCHEAMLVEKRVAMSVMGALRPGELPAKPRFKIVDDEADAAPKEG